ncbi:MAG TPA: DUF5069 domain-containing protein [Candidatus Baltobacteraceae bacterium]|jgi:hypothetical protein
MSPNPDLRVDPPRRWSVELDGVAWLPRLIDKARAASSGTLGGYLYGQSPTDSGLLKTLGIGYRSFADLVSRAPDDAAVAAALLARDPESIARARAWSADLRRNHKAFLWTMDLDDGYHPGAAWVKGPVNVLSNAFTALVKRVVPGPVVPPKP